jgi:hypothetical protein
MTTARSNDAADAPVPARATPARGYWPCGCVRTDASGAVTHRRLNPPGCLRCRRCGQGCGDLFVACEEDRPVPVTMRFERSEPLLDPEAERT